MLYSVFEAGSRWLVHHLLRLLWNMCRVLDALLWWTADCVWSVWGVQFVCDPLTLNIRCVVVLGGFSFSTDKTALGERVQLFCILFSIINKTSVFLLTCNWRVGYLSEPCRLSCLQLWFSLNDSPLSPCKWHTSRSPAVCCSNILCYKSVVDAKRLQWGFLGMDFPRKK